MADSLAQRRADGKKGITAVIDIAMEKLYPVAQEVKNEERELEKYGENRAILAVLLHHTDKIILCGLVFYLPYGNHHILVIRAEFRSFKSKAGPESFFGFCKLSCCLGSLSACGVPILQSFRGGVVIAVSFLTSRFTNILDVYRSGGKLFGGKYLILLYAGMVTASYYEKLRASPWKCLLFLCLALCWWRFERIDRFALDRKLHFGDGIGSPNLSLALMAVLLAGFLFNLEFLMRKNSFLRKISGGWAWFGSHTLYIFLYHRFFLDFFLLGFSTLDENIWIKRIAYFSVMASGPIAIEYAVRGIKMLYKKSRIVVSLMVRADGNT